MTKKSNTISAIIITIVLLASGYNYRQNITNITDDNTEQTLSEIVRLQKYSIEETVENKQRLLKDLADSIGLLGEDFVLFHPDEISSFISHLESDFTFDNIIISQIDGYAIDSSGETIDLSTNDFYLEIINGDNDSKVSSVKKSPYSGEDVVFFHELILDVDENVIGIAMAELDTSVLTRSLVDLYDGVGLSVVIDANGEIVAASENVMNLVGEDANLHNIFLSDYIEDEFSVEGTIEMLKSTEDTIHTSFVYDDVENRFEHMKVNHTNWVLIFSMPSSVLEGAANGIILHTTALLTEVFVIALILVYCIYRIKRSSSIEIEKLAYYDPLTELSNLKKFKIEVEKKLLDNKEEQFSVAKFDVVNFKVINKLFNYEIGNDVIKVIADNLKAVDRDKVLFASAGADEFIMFSSTKMLYDFYYIKHTFENKVMTELEDVCNRELKFRYSVYKIPTGETNVDDIIDTVTLTHNYSKNKSVEGIFDYDDNFKKQFLHDTFICEIMRDALKNCEFKVYLQGKTNLENSTICGAEALVRWHRPGGKIIYPNEFISIFEREGFIIELDKYMLNEVCKILCRFKNLGIEEIPISINFSRLHMLDDGFVEEISSVVDSYGIDRSLIEIEMTETSMIDNEADFIKLFSDLHDRGFTLSMDDFGAGYSSLALLTDLNFDVLKLDKSLIDESEVSDKKRLVINTVLNMAKALSLKTVCEGVEREGQVKFLKEAGCDVAQGYYFSRPMPNEDFENILKNSLVKI